MVPLGIKAPNSFMSLQSIQNQQQQVLQKVLSFVEAAKHNYTAKAQEDSTINLKKRKNSLSFFSSALGINRLKHISQSGTL